LTHQETRLETVKVATRVAGVSLHRPQLVYVEDQQPWGTAVLERVAESPRLEHAILRLELGPEVASQCAADGVSSGGRTVRFAMKSWLEARDLTRTLDNQPGKASWYTLLVEHGLLAHPDRLLASTQTAVAGMASPETKEMDASCTAALSEFSRRLEGLLATRTSTPLIFTVRCNECFQLEQERLRKGRMPGGTPPPFHARWTWHDGVRGDARPNCAHVPLGASALQALCKRYPELVFELLGWLVPEGALQRQGPQSEKPVRESHRFVLEPTVLETLLGSWLLDERIQRARLRAQRGYDLSPRERRSFHLSVAARRAQGGSPLPAKLRAGVTFAAAAWGTEAPIEQLAWMPGLSSGSEPAPVRQPVFDIKASDPLDVPRFLPEVGPRQPPRSEREPPGRSRVPKREAATPRAREAHRRAK
jgi:hypothetical protein